jgi:hypothetical protein
MDSDSTMNSAGEYRFFKHTDDEDDLPDYALNLDYRKNYKDIQNRPDAIFSLKPPFDFYEYRKQIEKAWKAVIMKRKQEIYPLGSINSKIKNGFVSTTKKHILERGKVTEYCKDYCVVVYNKRDNSAIGHMTFELSVVIKEDEKTVDLSFDIPIAWIVPQQRGVGFGLNLGTICGSIAAQKYREIAQCLSAEWTMKADITCEYESRGGKEIAEKFYSCLEIEWDLMKCQCKRERVEWHYFYGCDF